MQGLDTVIQRMRQTEPMLGEALLHTVPIRGLEDCMHKSGFAYRNALSASSPAPHRLKQTLERRRG